jgi:ABC-type phosphate transport system substrate-binding protein
MRNIALLVLLLSLIPCAYAQDNAVTVYAYTKAVSKTLTKQQIIDIFLLRRRNWNGARIRVYILPTDSPLHKAFARSVLNIEPFWLEAYWNRIIYSGSGLSPRVVSSLDEMRKALELDRHGIGYLVR